MRKIVESALISISGKRSDQYGKADGKVTEKRHRNKIKEIIDPQGQHCTKWSVIFLFSCVIAVSLDPLFFYIPRIDEETKCLEMDRKLRNIAIILRSVTDVTYVVHVIFRIRSDLLGEHASGDTEKGWINHVLPITKRISWGYIVIDILAVLPIPQVVMSIYFSKMKPSTSFSTRKLLNFFILVQYVPRIFRIYLSCKELTRNSSASEVTGTAWVKGAFNFFLYILASHVIGAFWYLFAVERETACWHHTCKGKDYEGCRPETFYCDGISRDRKFLNESCPANPTNQTVFDFGMFDDALQSGVVDSVDFLQKFFHCFSWGLRNLCSFGSNLKTSNYVWENIFAVFISITGLLLFMYLLGNLQTYLQMAAARSHEKRRKMQMKELDINLWMENNRIDEDMKKDIMYYARHKLQEHKDVDLMNLLHILPPKHKKRIKQHLSLPILKKRFVTWMEKMLDEIFIDHIKPVIYKERSYILREGEPLDQMLFFTQGTIWTYKSNIQERLDYSNTKCLEKGDFYGEELLNWALKSTSLTGLPICHGNVRSHTKVEAFYIMARDLNNLINDSWWRFSRNLSNSTNSDHSERWATSAASSLQAAWRRRREKKPEKYQCLSSSAGGALLISSLVNKANI